MFEPAAARVFLFWVYGYAKMFWFANVGRNCKCINRVRVYGMGGLCGCYIKMSEFYF